MKRLLQLFKSFYHKNLLAALATTCWKWRSGSYVKTHQGCRIEQGLLLSGLLLHSGGEVCLYIGEAGDYAVIYCYRVHMMLSNNLLKTVWVYLLISTMDTLKSLQRARRYSNALCFVSMFSCMMSSDGNNVVISNGVTNSVSFFSNE